MNFNGKVSQTAHASVSALSGQCVRSSCRCPTVRLLLKPLPPGPGMCCNGTSGPAQVSSCHCEVCTFLLHEVRVPGEQGCNRRCLAVLGCFALLSSKKSLKHTLSQLLCCAGLQRGPHRLQMECQSLSGLLGAGVRLATRQHVGRKYLACRATNLCPLPGQTACLQCQPFLPGAGLLFTAVAQQHDVAATPGPLTDLSPLSTYTAEAVPN